MFSKMMNSFYYGKSGKGDFRKEDLPKNRWQLFWDMLRVRFSSLFRMNLMVVVIFLPLIYIIGNSANIFLSGVSTYSSVAQTVEDAGIVRTADMSDEEYMALVTQALTDASTASTDTTEVVASPADQAEFFTKFDMTEFLKSIAWYLVIWCIPCIAITGPVQAGMAYVTRNWARDEHAFVWADFRDAVKENWKQALLVSCITSILPVVLYTCWNFYGSMAADNAFFIVPQVLVLVLVLVWLLGVTFMYPMMVSYKVSAGTLIKNSLLMGIARLPQTVGIRLITLLPGMLALLLLYFTSVGVYALMVLGAFYLVLGYALSRFIIASYTNAVFDKFINSHMEGVEVDRGLSHEDEDEDEELPQTQDPSAEDGKNLPQ